MVSTILSKIKAYTIQKVNIVYKNIATEILNNINNITNLKIKDIAEKANCSQSSVTKFCKILGYNGFKDIIPILSMENGYVLDGSLEMPTLEQREQTEEKLLEMSEQYIIRAIKDFSNSWKEIIEVARLIRQAKKIFIFGVGYNSSVILTFQMDLQNLGYNVVYSVNPYDQINYADLAKEDALAMFVTYSSVLPEIVEMFNKVKHSKCKIVTITKNYNYKIALDSNIVIPLTCNESFNVERWHARIQILYLFRQILILLKNFD